MTRENEGELDHRAIVELVQGLDPIDWIQLKLISQLPPEKRIMPGMQALEFARAMVRGAIMKRFPELSPSEVNMRMLRQLTTVRME